MKISIIGCGYVGLVTGVCLANSKNKIFLHDQDTKRIQSIKSGKNLIYEKGLKKKLNFAKKNKNIFFCDKLDDAINKSDVAFVCVGTPFKNKDINLKYVNIVTKQIAKALKKKKFFTIIYKSTIPPLTVENNCIPIFEKILGKKAVESLNFVFNPEFLREGNAIYDFENPKRIVVGIKNNRSKTILNNVYKKYLKKSKMIFVDIKTAEFIKYFSNSFFSLLISYSNEISNLCQKIGIDYINVLDAFKLDNRLNIKNKNPEFINYLVPGIGYGGSCFPKDVKTFIKFSEKNKFKLSILENVDIVNKLQPKIISEIILEKLKVNKIKDCLILGLTFKENTDDIRNSTSIDVVNSLAKDKIKIFVYDPIFSKKKFLDNKNLFHKKVIYLDKIDFNRKFEFIVVNNISKEFQKILKIYDNKYNSMIYDSRRAFRYHKFQNYFGSGLIK